MDRIVLDTPPEHWRRLAIFPALHAESLRDLGLGSHYLELVADTGNTHYYRAVLGKIHGKPVGYMRSYMASYFQPQIIRLNKAGITPFLHCKIITPNMVLHRTLSSDELKLQVNDLISVKRLMDEISS
jgi:hypothetical protein